VLAQDLATALVAEAAHHLRVADDVGEEDGAEGGRLRLACFLLGHAEELFDRVERGAGVPEVRRGLRAFQQKEARVRDSGCEITSNA